MAGLVIVGSVVFMWGLVAAVSGLIAGQVLRWGVDLAGGDGSRIQGPFAFVVAACVFVVALAVVLYRRVMDGVDPLRRWFYGLVWDWVETGYVESAAPAVPTEPASCRRGFPPGRSRYSSR